MATRLYLHSFVEGTHISPTPHSDWENTRHFTRGICGTARRSSPMTTVDFIDNDATSQDILLRQYISYPMPASQAFTEFSQIEFICRVLEGTLSNNMFFTVGVRIWNETLGAQQKIIFPVTRIGNEADAASMLGRYWIDATAMGDYVTHANGTDRILIEVGMGGDPAAGKDHGCSMRFGDASASDLTGEGETVDNNPWIEFAETFTFTTPTFSPKVTILGNTTILGSTTIL